MDDIFSKEIELSSAHWCMSGARRFPVADRGEAHVMRKTITKRAVDALKAGKSLADTDLPGFVVRRLPSGRLSYGYRCTKERR